MTEIHKNCIALFRFLTPFPHLPPQRLPNSALKAYHFKTDVWKIIENIKFRLIVNWM